MTKEEEKLLTAWLTEVNRKAEEVDPDREHDWFDLCYGFFLGKGLSPSPAKALAVKAQKRRFL